MSYQVKANCTDCGIEYTFWHDEKVKVDQHLNFQIKCQTDNCECQELIVEAVF